MKTKEQKRKEAIERLEREPRLTSNAMRVGLLDVDLLRERRRTEATRLRKQFGYQSNPETKL